MTAPVSWSACRKGCPDPYDCPHQPPRSERCPASWGNDGDGYSQCKVVGPHDWHRDGHGMTWRLDWAD